MPELVKQIVDGDGMPVEKDDQYWHLLTNISGGEEGMFCTGEYVNEGGNNEGGYKFKTTKRGGITCRRCLSKIKEIKAIKL